MYNTFPINCYSCLILELLDNWTRIGDLSIEAIGVDDRSI